METETDSPEGEVVHRDPNSVIGGSVPFNGVRTLYARAEISPSPRPFLYLSVEQTKDSVGVNRSTFTN